MKIRCVESNSVHRKEKYSKTTLSFSKGDIIDVIGKTTRDYILKVAGETKYFYIEKKYFEPYDEDKEILAEMIAEYKKKKEKSEDFIDPNLVKSFCEGIRKEALRGWYDDEWNKLLRGM